MRWDERNAADLLLKSINTQREDLLRTQLCEMVQSGVLEVVETQPVITLYEDAMRFPGGEKQVKFSQAVKLTFRGAERIAALEAENDELRKRLATIRAAAGEPE